MATSPAIPDLLQRLGQNIGALPRPPQNPLGQISPGNIDIYDRPIVRNPDGSSSTVRSMSYGDDRGETLVPTVSDGADGLAPHIMNNRQAIGYSRNTGQNLGTFDTPDHATAYAQALHEQQAKLGSFGGRTTMPAVITPDITNGLRRLQADAPPALASLSGMPSANPLASMPASVLPNVSLRPPTSADITGSRLLGDQTELKRLSSSGDGISQIKNKPARVLARIGDVAESILAPGAAAFTPGTALHHQMLLRQQEGLVNNDLANQQDQAKTEQTEANTDYLEQRPEIEQSKIDQKQTAVRSRIGEQAAANGQLVSWDENGVPAFTDDHTSQAFANRQALSAMHQATADKSAIMADIQKNHFIPGTPEFDEAQRKLAQVDKRMQVAMAGLGLRAQSLDLRRQNMNASLYGTDNSGNALPGAAQITGDDGTATTVGSKFAPTAIKANSKTVTFNDLTGSVSHLRNAIKAYEAEGGDMSDPRLAAAASDPHSTVGKVIQGKLVTGGLSPSAITLLNAQRQTEEQAGILRSTTGGTSSEAGAQRILAVVPHFGSDTNQSAYSKLDEQEGVLKRLSPGQTHVQGGVSVSKPGGGGVQVFRDGNTTYHIPANQVADFKKDHPNAR